MPTVIERLRELHDRAALASEPLNGTITITANGSEQVALARYLMEAHKTLPALLALADAVKAVRDDSWSVNNETFEREVRVIELDDYRAMVKALADLEKEAT